MHDLDEDGTCRRGSAEKFVYETEIMAIRKLDMAAENDISNSPSLPWSTLARVCIWISTHLECRCAGREYKVRRITVNEAQIWNLIHIKRDPAASPKLSANICQLPRIQLVYREILPIGA